MSISGTNDGPVAQGAGFTVNEDAALVNGSVLATDTDANAVLSFALNGATPAGLVFNANGSYSFDASNAAYQSLAAGQTQVITVPYTVTDDQGANSTANLVITVVGTNDAAVIGGVATGSVTEDGVALASGNLTITDVDGSASFTPASVAGTYGSFTIAANGAWSYTLNNASPAVQALTSAQQPVESFTVTAADGTATTVTVTVNGTNEAPTAAITPASGNEDNAIPVTLGGSDIDGSIASFTIGSLPANGTLLFGGAPVTLGQLIPATAGSASLSFVPSANWNGSTSFDFSATDNEGASSASVSVPIAVNAVGDTAVIGGTASGATVEDTTLSASGTLTVTDPDAGEAAFVPQAGVAGAHGTFSIDAAGNWTYTLNNADPAVQALGAGQTLPAESFSVATLDGTTATVTVSIAGTNDGAVIGVGAGSVSEDLVLTTGGTLTISDTDSGESAFAPQPATAGLFGTFTLAADGSWTYALNNALPAVQALGPGQTLTETFPVASLDGTPSSVTVTINGTNDAALVSVGTGTVTEDTLLSAGGTLTISDIDGAASFVAQPATPAATAASRSRANGTWSYALNNALPAVQGLGAGQTLTETFNVAAADGTPTSVTVTIVGTDDAPVISSDTGAVTENTRPRRVAT